MALLATLLQACLLAAVCCHMVLAAPSVDLRTAASVSVSSWPELLAALAQSGVQNITLHEPQGGRYIVTQTAQISSRRSLVVAGSGLGGTVVLIDCAGAATAFSIIKSTGVELLNLRIKDCSRSAVRVADSPPGQQGARGLTVRGCTFQDDSNVIGSGGGAVSAINADLTLQYSTFSNCSASQGGAVAANDTTLTVTGCTFSGGRALSAANGCGGALSSIGGSLDVHDTTFDSCSALCGGALRASDVTSLVLAGSRFENCSALSYGGALTYELNMDTSASGPAKFSILGSSFRSCRAGDTGGAMTALVMVFEAIAAMTFNDSSFEGCHSTNAGVALLSYHAQLRMHNTTFRGNSASVQGGTLLSVSDDLVASNCTFEGNEALQGGAMMLQPADATVPTHTFEGCRFVNNSAGREGGAIYGLNASFTLMSCSFEANRASIGAGLYLLADSGTDANGTPGPAPDGNMVVVAKSTFTDNVANEYGAGIGADGAAELLVQDRCVFQGNKAMGSGAGITVLQVTSTTIDDSQFVGNDASFGGALRGNSGSGAININGSAFSGNKAEHGGAIILNNSTARLYNTTLSANTAVAGGAIAAYAGSSITLGAGSRLNGNIAFLGGGVAAYSTQLLLAGCILDNNKAPANLDTPVVKFMAVSPPGLGGAVYMLDGGVKMVGASVINNTADGFGGGVYLQQSALTAVGGQLLGNRAYVAGGAIYVHNNAQSVDLVNMTVARNAAARGGGVAVTVMDLGPGAGAAQDGVPWSFAVTNVTFEANNAVFLGGGLSADATPEIVVRGCQFVRNSAGGSSGALGCTGCGRLLIEGSAFLGNTAPACGAASIISSTSATSITNCTFIGNAAKIDAAEAATAIKGQTLNLGALATAAAVARAVSGMAVEQVQLFGSTAVIAELLNRGAVAPGIQQAIQPSAAFQAFGQLPKWQSLGSGGALCLVPVAPIGVSGTVLRNNTAINGGAIFLDPATTLGSPLVFANDSAAYDNLAKDGTGSSVYTTRASAVSLAPSASLTGPTRLSRRARRLTAAAANAALATSGATATGATAVSVSRALATSPARLVILDPLLATAATAGKSGSMRRPPLLLSSTGSLPDVSVALVDEFGQMVPSAVAEQLAIEASAADTTGDQTRLVGLTSIIPLGGTSNFTKLLLQGPPGGTFAVTFSVPLLSQLTPVTLLVTKSNCSAGQALQMGEAGMPIGCTTCNAPLFSFDPSDARCEVCPAHAAPCNGSLLLPKNGSYHSHPRSAQVWSCPGPQACIRSAEAQERMAALQRSLAAGGPAAVAALPDDVLSSYQQDMCGEGYTGPLCGSCAATGPDGQEYGRVWGRCAPCHKSRAAAIALYCLSRIFDLAVIALQIFIITKDRQRRQAVLARRGRSTAASAAYDLVTAAQKKRSGGQRLVETMGALGGPFRAPLEHKLGPEAAAAEAAEAEADVAAGQRDQGAASAFDCEDGTWAAAGQLPWSAAKLLPLDATKVAALGSSKGQEEGRAVDGAARGGDDGQEGWFAGEGALMHLQPVVLLEPQALKEQQQVPLEEQIYLGVYMEFIIEYCQLLSILRLAWVEAEWAPGAQFLYNTLAFTPLSSASWVSFDCMLAPGTSNEAKAYARIGAAIVVPVCYSLLISAFFIITIGTRRLRLGRRPLLPLQSLLPLILLSLVKVVSYCYPSITNAALKLFSCRTVDMPASIPGEVVAAQGAMWTQDYNVHCFEGLHLTFLLAVGLPALLVLVLGYPVGQWLLLSWQSRAGGLRAETQFWANYGMLYEDFRRRLYYWGSVKELRKLALVAVMVGLQTQSAGAQLVGAWSVVLVAVCSHLMLVPYRSGLLNILQLAMLGAVMATVYLNAFIAIPQVSPGASLAIQVTFLAIDCGVGLLLLYLLLVRAWQPIKSWLDADKDGHVTWSDVCTKGTGIGAAVSRTFAAAEPKGSQQAAARKLVVTGSPGITNDQGYVGHAVAEVGGGEGKGPLAKLKRVVSFGSQGSFSQRQLLLQQQQAQQQALAAAFGRQLPPPMAPAVAEENFEQ